MDINLIVGASMATPVVVQLAARLRELGFLVHVVLTERAASFINPVIWEAASGSSPHIEVEGSGVPHIALARHTGLTVVAPATADLIARSAIGLGDELATTLLLMSPGPVVWSPAMNPIMLNRTTTQMHMRNLATRGGLFVPTARGRDITGAEIAAGSMAPTGEIVDTVLSLAKMRVPEPQGSIIIESKTTLSRRPVHLFAISLLHLIAHAGFTIPDFERVDELDLPPHSRQPADGEAAFCVRVEEECVTVADDDTHWELTVRSHGDDVGISLDDATDDAGTFTVADALDGRTAVAAMGSLLQHVVAARDLTSYVKS